MESKIAQEIIKENHLIQGPIGRKILLAIENQLPIPNDLPPGITAKEIKDLKCLYDKKILEFSGPVFPRNFIFYQLIKEIIPDFSWSINKNRVILKGPRIKNLRPSLLSLLLNKINIEEDVLLNRKYRCVEKMLPQVVKVLSKLMEKIEVIFPDEQGMESILKWVQIGLQGEPLTIFSPVCPDYSVEPTDIPNCPFRHTFNELGSGIGLIAQRILAAFPLVLDTLQSVGLKPKVVVGLGDFEAYSETNLKRLNLTMPVFLERLTKSKEAFEQACSFPCDIAMITELFGGYDPWLQSFNEFTNRLNQGDFGSSALTEKKLLKIVEKRKNLYDRCYGKQSLLDHLPQLLNQGAEYAALGAAIFARFKNCLVLGADNDAMGSFYSVSHPIPALYLKRFYC